MDARTVFEPDEVQAMSHRSVEDNSSQHHHAVNNNSILDSNSLHPDATRGYVNSNSLPDLSSHSDNLTVNSRNNSRDNISNNIIISRPNDNNDDLGLNSFDNVSNDSNANRSRDSFVLSNNISRSSDSYAAGDGTTTTPQVLLYASNTSSNNESESSSNPVNASTQESSNPDRRSNINISINGIVVESMSGDNQSSNTSNGHESVTSNNSTELLNSGSDNDGALQEDDINSNSSISAEDTSREEETAVGAVGLFGQRNLVSDDFSSSSVGGLFSGKRHQVFFLFFTTHLTIYQSILLLR
jgi:hypothetical protein